MLKKQNINITPNDFEVSNWTNYSLKAVVKRYRKAYITLKHVPLYKIVKLFNPKNKNDTQTTKLLNSSVPPLGRSSSKDPSAMSFPLPTIKGSKDLEKYVFLPNISHI